MLENKQRVTNVGSLTKNEVNLPSASSSLTVLLYLYNFNPIKSHYLGFTGVYIIFLISSKKHRLWVLVRTATARRF